jgi:hypothetical protein
MNRKDELASELRRMRQPRPFLTYRKPVSPLPPEISDPVEIWSRIEAFIFNEEVCRFIPSGRALKIASPTPKTPGGDIGFLLRFFKLSEIRKLLERPDRSEAEDSDILSVLDKFSSARKLKVIACEIKKFCHVSDISFTAEIGTGVREIRSPWTIPKFYEIVWYLDKPLDKSNYLFGNRTIENVTERVQKLRDRRDQVFRKVFGWKDLKLESALHHEDVLADAELRRNVAILASAKIDKSDKPDQDKNQE